MMALVRILTIDPTPAVYPMPQGEDSQFRDRFKSFCTGQFLRDRCKVAVMFADEHHVPDELTELRSLIATLQEREAQILAERDESCQGKLPLNASGVSVHECVKTEEATAVNLDGSLSPTKQEVQS